MAEPTRPRAEVHAQAAEEALTNAREFIYPSEVAFHLSLATAEALLAIAGEIALLRKAVVAK